MPFRCFSPVRCNTRGRSLRPCSLCTVGSAAQRLCHEDASTRPDNSLPNPTRRGQTNKLKPIEIQRIRHHKLCLVETNRGLVENHLKASMLARRQCLTVSITVGRWRGFVYALPLQPRNLGPIFTLSSNPSRGKRHGEASITTSLSRRRGPNRRDQTGRSVEPHVV
jgi:hypothetical protein